MVDSSTFIFFYTSATAVPTGSIRRRPQALNENIDAPSLPFDCSVFNHAFDASYFAHTHSWSPRRALSSGFLSMSLNTLVANSKLSPQCKNDIARLTDEYNASVAASIERSREMRSSSRVRRSKGSELCKPLTPQVPHGHYKTSPVFTRTLPRSSDIGASNSFGFSNSAATSRGRAVTGTSLPNIARSDEDNDYLLKKANYEHASRVRGAVASREGTDAHQAYTDAFLSYTGRHPTQNELRQADQYQFVKDSASGRDVIADERALSRLSNLSGKSEFYYLKRLPTDTKQYPPFRKTMAPKMN